MNIKKHISSLVISIIWLSAICSPEAAQAKNVKKVPKTHSENYNYPNVKSKKTEINQKPWIVYSDRARNTTSHIPGGTVVLRELEFMEPLLVIDIKGDYFKLIKYSEDILKDTKIIDRKKMENYGWIHRDRLLLFNNSVTEIRNGIKLKSTVALTDTTTILHPTSYVKNNMVKFYKHPSLEEESGIAPLNTIVYILKFADNNTRALVSYKSSVKPNDAGTTVCGWVDASMVLPLGQRLTLNDHLKVLPARDTVLFMPDGTPEYGMYSSTVSSPYSFTPMIYSDRTDDGLYFRTLDLKPVIDKSDNRVFNVDGELISYNKSLEIEKELSKVNVIFAFDMTKNVLLQMPVWSNAVQNIKSVFDDSNPQFKYHYSAVLGDFIVPMNTDYQSFSDQMIAAVGEISEYNRIYSDEWSLEHAVDLAELMPGATNIIVHIGEEVASGEKAEQKIANGFINNNCRLLSFQVYSGGQDSYNNFVLQATSVIEAYADAMLDMKRKNIVYPDQLRTENFFREVTRNSYSLDFPEKSITQGIIMFPEKKNSLLPKDLINAVNTMVREVESDNLLLIESLNKAFMQIGNHRDKYDPYFVSRFGIDHGRKIDREFKTVFNEVSPDWVAVTNRVSVGIDSTVVSNMSLLLTETELDELKQFMDKLYARKIEIKGTSQSHGKKTKDVDKVRKDIKYIPADSQFGTYYTQEDSVEYRTYASTGKVRKYLKKTYINELKSCVVDGKPKHLTLASAQEYITSAPTAHPVLNNIKIKDITSKKLLPDTQLDILLSYFVYQRQLLEKSVKPADEINIIQGEKYYLLGLTALP